MLNRIKWFYHSVWSSYHRHMADSVNLEEDWFDAFNHHADRAEFHERMAVKAAWEM